MEVENSVSDVENVGDEDIEAKPAVDAKAAGDVSTTVERLRKKAKRVVRQNSKEGIGAVGPIPQHRSWKNSRRPRNGYGRGLPKKGGGGGKGVWGKPGSEVLEEYQEDSDDPNYDSEAPTNGDLVLKQVLLEEDHEDLIKKSEPIILEYFEHGDTSEAADSFLEFIVPAKRHLIVETIIEIALDHKPSHCEMASVLISDLYGRVFNSKDIAVAMERLMANLPDLILDTPEAVTLLSNFVARCVADDCLPPRFVQEHIKNLDNDLAVQVMTRADTLLSMKHGLVRLDNVWGVGGGLRPVKSLIRQMGLLLREYLSSGVLQEAIRCVRALEVPHFHHELVYEAVVMALEAVSVAVEQQLCNLLAELHTTCVLTPDQMERGFLRVLEDMADIVLDVPLAYIMLDRFVERCSQRFQLSPNIQRKMPNRGRKRYVSEGDGGHIKEHVLRLRE